MRELIRSNNSGEDIVLLLEKCGSERLDTGYVSFFVTFYEELL